MAKLPRLTYFNFYTLINSTDLIIIVENRLLYICFLIQIITKSSQKNQYIFYAN